MIQYNLTKLITFTIANNFLVLFQICQNWNTRQTCHDQAWLTIDSAGNRTKVNLIVYQKRHPSLFSVVHSVIKTESNYRSVIIRQYIYFILDWHKSRVSTTRRLLSWVISLDDKYCACWSSHAW